MSTFSGLNTANTALWAAQRAMDVTGQNVANANTDGYSRQRVDLQSVAAPAVPAMWSTSGQVGQGVNSDSVIRIRDAFLEAQAQSAHAATSSLTVQNDALDQIQQGFREPGTDGVQAQLSNMWAGWGDVANNPSGAAAAGARAQLLQRSQTLVAGITSTNASLDRQWSTSHDALQTLLTDVNATASSIADLNQSIKRADQAGLPSNELADKRDALVLKLSEQVGATSSPAQDGTLDVVVGGTTLVSGNTALGLKLTGANDARSVGSSPLTVSTVPGNTPVRLGGTASGQLTAMTTIIPGYQQQLDAVAQQLATQVNAVHENGYDQDGNPGGMYFTDGGTSDTDVTAANITLGITDTRKVAAASLSPAAAGGTQQADGTWTVVSADGSHADALNQLSLSGTGTDASYRKMIVKLGVQATTTSSNLSTQSVISTNVDASRESVSGVNLDEEMTNMLQFQHGYQAAGKLVSTIDAMLDSLLNMIG